VNNAPLQQWTNFSGNLGIAVQNYLHVLLAIHTLKVNNAPLFFGVYKYGTGGGCVADQGSPDAGKGGYRVSHDAFRMVLQQTFLEASRRKARFDREAMKGGECGFIVSDAMCSVSGTAMAQRGEKEGT
jgi:hypothetical protein